MKQVFRQAAARPGPAEGQIDMYTCWLTKLWQLNVLSSWMPSMYSKCNTYMTSLAQQLLDVLNSLQLLLLIAHHTQRASTIISC